MSSLREVLDKVASNQISPAEAEKILQLLAIDEVGCLAKLDGNRGLRKGIPEIILAEGKSASDVAEISRRMVANCGRAIVSRCAKEHILAVKEAFQNDVQMEINDKARMVIVKRKVSALLQAGVELGF